MNENKMYEDKIRLGQFLSLKGIKSVIIRANRTDDNYMNYLELGEFDSKIAMAIFSDDLLQKPVISFFNIDNQDILVIADCQDIVEKYKTIIENKGS